MTRSMESMRGGKTFRNYSYGSVLKNKKRKTNSEFCFIGGGGESTGKKERAMAMATGHRDLAQSTPSCREALTVEPSALRTIPAFRTTAATTLQH